MEETHLERRLGLVDAISMMVGIILGSGIFVAPAAIAQIASSPAWAALAWIVGGSVAFCGALCYAECGARLPMDGGFFVFFERAWSPAWAFVAGWAALFITYPTSLAGVATIGARYLSELWTPAGESPHLYTMGMLSLAALLNVFGVQLERWAARLLTGSKLLTLVCVGVAALCHGLWGGASTAAPTTALPPLAPADAAAFLAAFVVVMWTYDGWTDITLVAGEMENPARNLSRTVFFGLATLMGVYVLVQTAVLTILSSAEAAQSDQVFALAVGRGLGPHAGTLVAALVVLSVAGSVHGMTWVTSRLAYAMALRGALPRYFAHVSPRVQVPVRAVLLVYSAAMAYAAFEDFTQLVSFFAFVVWLFYASTALALLRLRRRGVGEPLEWRAPGGIVPPAVLVTAALAMLALQCAEHPMRSGIGLGVLACIAVVLRWREGRAARA